jgi:Fic family protein
MMTLRQFASGMESIPTATAWYLADLGQALGKQELFTRQSPQRLKVLREHAMIESAVSSNRIEGVEVEPSRVGTIVFGRPSLRDRNEEELRGYRDALKLIHEEGQSLAVSEEAVQRLHKLTRGEIWDAGRYKEKDGRSSRSIPIRERVRFRPVPARETPAACASWFHCGVMPPRAATPRSSPLRRSISTSCAFIRRGWHDRSRLLFLLQCYHPGYEVGRYISLERLIEQNKERYYETLEHSSAGCPTGSTTHGPT